MGLQIDMHCHSFFSGDAVSSPEEMIESAKKRGLNGFVITDHNTCEGYHYMVDQGLANEDGTPVDGFLILPGVEVTTAEGHLICVGATLPAMRREKAEDVCRLIHQAGGLAIPPHPYDLFRAGIREAVLDTLEIDALEVFNAATTLKRYNRRAFDYAKGRSLPMTAGSDAHHADAIGTAFTIFPTTDFTVAGIRHQLLQFTELTQRYMTPGNSFRKTWNNWLRLRPKRRHQRGGEKSGPGNAGHKS
jgi:predicted metal-dependent phosphoesterase TrpH